MFLNHFGSIGTCFPYEQEVDTEVFLNHFGSIGTAKCVTDLGAQF